MSYFIASSSRSLPLRKRADLSVVEQTFQGRRFYVVKDPLSLKYCRFEEEEFALFQMLDGHASLDRLQAAYAERFAPQRISLSELQRLLGMLHENGLIVSDAAGQGAQLAARSRRRSGRQRQAALANILSLRLRGFDPTRLLTWLDRQAGWLLSARGIVCGLVFAAAALLLALVHFDEFRLRLPGFREFFAAGNWPWLAATLAVTKIVHELGHGLACKRSRGECHEMGLMLLVFTPCLYCNVSDSWMLPSKWRRAAIAAAGMYVELLLAAAATFLWWFSHPGLFNYLCLNVMFVCSVSTLVFNANPLLKYDGYYILSDLAEIPNLRSRADELLRAFFARLLFGLRTPHPYMPQRHRGWFAVYATAAMIYRWVVTLGVLWFLYSVLEPYGLAIVGRLLAAAVVAAMIAQPMIKLVKLWRLPGRSVRVSKPRLTIVCLVAGALAAAVMLAPLPHYVHCDVSLAPRDAQSVYVAVGGELAETRVRGGEIVRQDEPLATLVNHDLQLEIERLEGEQRRLTARLAALERRAINDEAAAHRLEQTKESLASIENQFAKREADRQRLVLKAPVGGEVIWPESKAPVRPDRLRLASWSGSPLDEANRGAWLDEGVLVCKIGDSSHLSAMLTIDQEEIEFVAPGQPVAIVLESLPNERYWTTIEQVSRVEREPAEESSAKQPPVFQASAPLSDDRGLVVIGGSGRAKIRVGSRTIGERLWRAFCSVFEFEM